MASNATTVWCPISGITVDFSESRTDIEFAEVLIGNDFRLPIRRRAGRSWRETFSETIVLSRSDAFFLRISYKEHFKTELKHEDIHFDLDDTFRAYSAGEGQAYIKWHGKIRIVVDLSENTSTEIKLLPTTSRMFERCPRLTLPRFRILVIGKTGVGKSSLIEHVFGVGAKTTVAHDEPGEAIIDHEFISPQNDKFIVHDSKGFEPGKEDNLNLVRDFIQRRRAMPDLKDQLHAVWLCFQIPFAGGRFLETGTEKFLTWKRDGTLGDIPVIVVLTKYDVLVNQMELELDETSIDGLSDEEIKELAKTEADIEIRVNCIKPLKRFAGSDIPHAIISTKADYKETLASLIQTTEKYVGQHSTPEAAVMTSIAQRVHSGLKIEALINFALMIRYWKVLGSCPLFKNRKMRDCLDVLHTDIVDVWNFRDPQKYLRSPDFKAMIINMVDGIQVELTADPTKTIVTGLTVLGTLTTIVSALAAHAVPIVVPIVASGVLAAWAQDVYQTSDVVLRRFMTYIIHLTLVLQTLFIVSESQGLTRRAIKLAVKSYSDSGMGEEVVIRIQDHIRQLTFLDHADRDTVNKIEEVIQFYKIDEAEMSKLRVKRPTGALQRAKHEYIAIRFVPQAAYERATSLNISPQSDVVTRVCMLFEKNDVAWWADVVGVDPTRAGDVTLFRVYIGIRGRGGGSHLIFYRTNLFFASHENN
ncbi:uncharacterized protein F5891DRAFT_978078 [Suillus fuscotomentosus]|uniref:G domain-containing protein n=1 Tax=Suillus fuscotomentosus TaxID=1912939 RepID=A0AAD4HPR5_9AGAM|nr:uncharacterized protein F5891DRAFT_978078 [Suillus fuscotomentosus]KAG1903029.1 hypothetical protein F5891DRAFT_978078 [Suillus fuscotomentosus]